MLYRAMALDTSVMAFFFVQIGISVKFKEVKNPSSVVDEILRELISIADTDFSRSKNQRSSGIGYGHKTV